MKKVNRKDIVLYLLDRGGEKPISGRTRLQKLLFLLEAEHGIGKQLSTGFSFMPYRFGPFSAELFKDIEFLENVGLISARKTGDPTEAERGELDILGMDYLDDDAEPFVDQMYVEEDFSLTERGKDFVNTRLKTRLPKHLKVAIQEIVRNYADLPLSRLIRYVYGKFPKYAVNSELGHYIGR